MWRKPDFFGQFHTLRERRRLVHRVGGGLYCAEEAEGRQALQVKQNGVLEA
jgi:hypothetical protein